MGRRELEDHRTSSEVLTDALDSLHAILDDALPRLSATQQSNLFSEFRNIIAARGGWQEIGYLDSDATLVDSEELSEQASIVLAHDLTPSDPKAVVITDKTGFTSSESGWVPSLRAYLHHLAEDQANVDAMINLMRRLQAGHHKGADALSSGPRPEVSTTYENLAPNLWFCISMHQGNIKSLLSRISSELDLDIHVKSPGNNYFELLRSKTPAGPKEALFQVPPPSFALPANSQASPPVVKSVSPFSLTPGRVAPENIDDWELEDFLPFLLETSGVGPLCKLTGHYSSRVEQWFRTRPFNMGSIHKKLHDVSVHQSSHQKADRLCVHCNRELNIKFLQIEEAQEVIEVLDSKEDVVEFFNTDEFKLELWLRAHKISLGQKGRDLTLNPEEVTLEVKAQSRKFEDVILLYGYDGED